jgi:hypothetical protein
MPSWEDSTEARPAANCAGDPYAVLNLDGPGVLWALGDGSGAAGAGVPPARPPRVRLGGMMAIVLNEAPRCSLRGENEVFLQLVRRLLFHLRQLR